MEQIVYYALVAAGFGAMWWQHARGSRPRPRVGDWFDEDAEIALHLAAHEAGSRREAVAPIHLLFALVQDQTVADAIRKSGGDVEAIEDRLFAALETTDAPGRQKGESDEYTAEATAAIAWAVYPARGADRRATCVDLWGGLLRVDSGVAALLEAGGVEPAEVLFTLVHGVAEKDVEVPEGPEVEVVLINDDVSTRELVVEILQRVFDLPEDDATERMIETHETGRGSIGRHRVAAARAKVAAARRLARSQGYPLWFRIEPAAD